MRLRAKLEQILNIIWYPPSTVLGTGHTVLSLLSNNHFDLVLYYLIKIILFLITPLVFIVRLGHAYYHYIKKFLSSNPSDLSTVIKLLDNKKIMIIGNITVGGTGKTPVVAKLYEQLTHLGFFPGIISKGYLGSKVSVSPHQVSVNDNPKEWGDEPVLLAQRLKDCPIMVCKNRVTAIQALLTSFPQVNIILTDDGLQDKNLANLLAKLNQNQVMRCAVIDNQRGLGNQKLLPAGPLRQSKKHLLDLNYLIIHESTGSVEHAAISNLPGIQNKGIWVRSQISAFEQLDSELTFTPLQFSRTFHKIHAVTGIGHPERFFQSLVFLGMLVRSTAYPDHFDFQSADLQFEDNLPIVITEKDAVKIKPFAHAIKAPIWVAKLDIAGIKSLVDKIKNNLE